VESDLCVFCALHPRRANYFFLFVDVGKMSLEPAYNAIGIAWAQKIDLKLSIYLLDFLHGHLLKSKGNNFGRFADD